MELNRVCFLVCLGLLLLSVNVSADVSLEPFMYSENFESRTLGAWASYPHWQDIAYDPNFRVNEMVSGDSNISIEQKVTPYTNVDNYAGAQKLLDVYLVPGSSITLRYYLKSHLPSEYFIVRLAAGEHGKVDYRIPAPILNRWEWVTVTYDDFLTANPGLAGEGRIKVNAIAVLTKVPDADPTMPFYLGLDDITVKCMRVTQFQFAEPDVYKLAEWKQYIPKSHYVRDDTFTLDGRWPVDADQVELEIALFTKPDEVIDTYRLRKRGENWSLKPFKLKWDDGLYLATLTAYRDNEQIADTQFTIHLAPENIGGTHPRLWFTEETRQKIIDRLNSDRFSHVAKSIIENAASHRERVTVESLIFDLDQFPDENWLPTWSAWGSHIYHTDAALLWNALAYSLQGDRTAGEYAKDVLVKLAAFENWTHPWQTKRGRFNEHRTGSWSHRVALAYDLTYDLMSDVEREEIRKAIFENVVKGAHKTYVVNNNITGNTSNWIAMVLGGTLMNQTAMFGDGPDVENLEPYFTGAALKLYTFLKKVTDGDGAWGEGLGYNNYSFRNLSNSLPSLWNVMNIDMTPPLNGTFQEYIWAGLIKEKKYFYFGDTGGSLNHPENWAWLLDRNQDPLLGWYYNFLRGYHGESNTQLSNMDALKQNQHYMDVLYETLDVPQDDPFDENPVRLFRGVGTSVFKSGWDADDFVFVMRTGPFFNHQHIDQGSFWLADRGSIFIQERYGSTYYDDPLYQPWYTQPIGHSTILIDGNHQSQRVGDHQDFAEGFDDYAHVTHFLDGDQASFVTGDIGKLYWGKVRSLARNVLYLKPRTLLMLDTVTPSETDVDVTLLYQTEFLKDITATDDISRIERDGTVLNLVHCYPADKIVESVETPHYLHTLQRTRPLEKEGMLTVTARTKGHPTVLATILTTTGGEMADVDVSEGERCLSGTANGTPFICATRPGRIYQSDGFVTDALAVTWSNTAVFAAQTTQCSRDGAVVVESTEPITVEKKDISLKYYLSEKADVTIGLDSRPDEVSVNGTTMDDLRWNNESRTVILPLPAGEGVVTW